MQQVMHMLSLEAIQHLPRYKTVVHYYHVPRMEAVMEEMGKIMGVMEVLGEAQEVTQILQLAQEVDVHQISQIIVKIMVLVTQLYFQMAHIVGDKVKKITMIMEVQEEEVEQQVTEVSVVVKLWFPAQGD